MPTEFPQRRPARFNKVHMIGIAAGYVIVTVGALIFMMARDSAVTVPVKYVATGVAPASQSTVPTPRQ